MTRASRCRRRRIAPRTRESAGRVDGRETLVVPDRFQRREARVQAKVPVEIDHRLPWDGDARALLVIGRLTVRDDHVQAVDRAALEEADENRAAGGGEGAAKGVRGSSQEQWIESETHERQRAGFDEHSARDGHCLWKSGPPRARPSARSRACVGSLMSASCSRITSRVCVDMDPPSKRWLISSTNCAWLSAGAMLVHSLAIITAAFMRASSAPLFTQ